MLLNQETGRQESIVISHMKYTGYKSKFLKLEYWTLTLTIPTGRGLASEAHKNNFSLLIFNYFE